MSVINPKKSGISYLSFGRIALNSEATKKKILKGPIINCSQGGDNNFQRDLSYNIVNATIKYGITS